MGGVDHLDADAHLFGGGVAEDGIGMAVHLFVDPFAHGVVECAGVAVGGAGGFLCRQEATKLLLHRERPVDEWVLQSTNIAKQPINNFILCNLHSFCRENCGRG